MMSGVGVTRDSCNVETDEDEDIIRWAIVIGEVVDSIFTSKMHTWMKYIVHYDTPFSVVHPLPFLLDDPCYNIQ